MYSIASLLSKSDAIPVDPSQSLTLKSRERIQIICIVAQTILAAIGVLVAIYLHGIVGAVGGGFAGFCALDLLMAYVINRVKKCTAAAQTKRPTPLQKPARQLPKKQPIVTPCTAYPLRQKLQVITLAKIIDQRKTTLERQKSALTQKLNRVPKEQESVELTELLNTVDNDFVSLAKIVVYKDKLQSFYEDLDARDKADTDEFNAQLNAI